MHTGRLVADALLTGRWRQANALQLRRELVSHTLHTHINHPQP